MHFLHKNKMICHVRTVLFIPHERFLYLCFFLGSSRWFDEAQLVKFDVTYFHAATRI